MTTIIELSNAIDGYVNNRATTRDILIDQTQIEQIGLTIWQILSKWRQFYRIPNSNVKKFFSKLSLNCEKF
ncbi:hypothetical protein RhiirB3_530513 [Rhizophagus irregularis]|nr:hypothetical protein RhiirB3_530513 [Rhizophagus irregularis]